MFIQSISKNMSYKKKNKIKFYVLSILYLVITLADLYLTYIATPDLKQEGNPLVQNLNIGWTGLIIVNLITYIIYFILALYAYIIFKPVDSSEIDDKLYYFDIMKNKGKKASIKFQAAALCYSVSTALPLARFIIVFEWILILTKVKAPLFFSVVSLFPAGRIDYAAAILIAIKLSFYFYIKESRENRKRILLEF